jgi:hypothetical protein
MPSRPGCVANVTDTSIIFDRIAPLISAYVMWHQFYQRSVSLKVRYHALAA